jgi:hypothetical protein
LNVRYERAPVRVFVVWHPRYAQGEGAFKALYEWLGGTGRDLYHRGLGVPVQAWTSDTDECPPPELPPPEQLLTIIVPILDGEFLGRKSWREWIADLARCPGIVILPWAVHQASASVPGIRLLHLIGSGSIDTSQLCRRVTESCVVRIRELGPARNRAGDQEG